MSSMIQAWIGSSLVIAGNTCRPRGQERLIDQGAGTLEDTEAAELHRAPDAAHGVLGGQCGCFVLPANSVPLVASR